MRRLRYRERFIVPRNICVGGKMNESDHSDKESQDEMPALEVSSDSVNGEESGRKRRREESAEDSNFCAPSVKKMRGPVDDSTVQVSRSEASLESNGTVRDGKDDPEDTSVVGMEKEIEVEVEAEGEGEAEAEAASEGTANANKSNVGRDDDESAVASRDEYVDSEKEEVAEAGTTAARVTSDAEDAATKARTSEAEDEDEVKSARKKRGKSRIEDAEVVEGLELSVECASDKESSSSSGSEDGGDRKPVRKTIIVKAKPNDSELDVGSSEAEKSDLQDTRESKGKQRTRKGKKRGKSVGDSEGNNDDVSDEDYSPRTKRKLKRATTNKKGAKSSVQSRRGRGKGKKGSKGPTDTVEGDEDENSNVTEGRKADENASGDAESVKAASESNEFDSGDNSKDGTGKKASSGSEDKTIEQLKKYIRITGIHVKSYSDLWADCKSHAAKVRRLKELLEKNGVNGRPTMEKCKRARERNERLKDVAELNTSNIISEGRVTRAQRNKESRRSPETLAKRNTYKRVLSVVDSDSE